MIKSLNPKYFIYYKDNWKMKGLMQFETKKDMNLWLLLHGNNCEYIHVLSGFTLEERRIKK